MGGCPRWRGLHEKGCLGTRIYPKRRVPGGGEVKRDQILLRLESQA